MKRTTKILLASGLAAVGWRALRGHQSRGSDVLGPDGVADLYDHVAPVYDAIAGAYQTAAGLSLHRRAVDALGLQLGDTAVDLACGTGINFQYLVEAVGATGRVVGVDLSLGMLDLARRRVEANGWGNVTLIEGDVRQVTFPDPVHGVLSTFGLEMVPEHEDVIRRAVDALAMGGRLAIGGLRRPEGWPEWLIRVAELLNRPFGVSRAYEGIQPWRSVEAHAEGYRYEEFLLGAAYLATGTTPPTP